jgi:PAS domain S-box-containing protein
MNEKVKSILAIMLIIAALSGVFLYWGVRMYEKQMDSKIIETAGRTDILIDELINITNKIYDLRIDNIISDPRVVAAFKNRDREALVRVALPWHDLLKEENSFYGIMHFHLPSGHSFLRMHQPRMFGDDLSSIRPMIQEVHKNKTHVSAYEVGKYGFSYRVAKPVFDGDTYIGAVEIGIGVEETAKNIERLLDVKVARIISDDLLTDEFRQFSKDEILQNHLSVNPYGQKELFENIALDLEFNDLPPRRTVVGDREYVFYSSGHLKNYKGEVIAHFLTVQDISKEISSYRAFVKNGFILTLVLILGAFVVLHFSFGSMIHKIIELNRTLETRVKARTLDLKLASKKLRQANVELNQIFNTASDGMRVIGINHKVLRVNDSFTKIMGKTRQELVNRPCHGAFDKSACLTPDCTLQQVLRREAHIEMDVAKQFDSGETRSFILTAAPYKSPEGEILGVVENFKDITEREIASAALAESEKRYRFITEKTADMIWTSDMDLNSTYVSPSVSKLRGYTPKEDMSHSLEQKYTRISIRKIQQFVKGLRSKTRSKNRSTNRSKAGLNPFKESSTTLLLHTFHKNNSIIPVEVAITPIYDQTGEFTALHGVSRDITQRQKVYDILKENEEYLNAIMSTVQTGVIVTDSQNPLILDANPYAAELMGSSLEDLLKASPRDYFALEKSWIEKALSSRKKIEVGDYELRTAKGEYLTVRLSLATASVRGKTYLVQSFLDISDMKQLLEKQAVDIHMAKNIMTLINKDIPRYCPLPCGSRFFAEAICVPCNAEGGDHYFVQHFTTPEKGGEGKSFISLKDQSGHEVNCVLRSIFTDLLHNAVLHNPRIHKLEEVVGKLNNELCCSKFFSEDDFFTAIHAELDHQTLLLTYVSAGHPPFLLIRRGKVSAYPAPDSRANNLPMLFLKDIAYRADRLQLREKDQLVFYTDGLLEMTLKHLGHVLTTTDLIQIVGNIIEQGFKEGDSLPPVSKIMAKTLDHISLLSKEKVVARANGINQVNTSSDDVSLIGVEIESFGSSKEMILKPNDSNDIALFLGDFYDGFLEGEEAQEMGPLKSMIMLVLEETIVNAWKHGNKKDSNKAIIVRWSLGKDIVLEVIDQGKGFDYNDLPDPTIKENITMVSGRGLFIVRHSAYHVQWFDKGRHIMVTFKKEREASDEENSNKNFENIRLWQS